MMRDFFLENMRSCSINEAEEETLYVLERKKEEGQFCLNQVKVFAF